MNHCIGERKGEGEGEKGLEEGEVEDDEEGRDQDHKGRQKKNVFFGKTLKF